jgi:glycosyltransferase involved in cell wall biosynthesis
MENRFSVMHPVETPQAVGVAPQRKRPGGRILFTAWDFSIGGVGSYTLNFGRTLRRRGYTVGALVPEPFGELYSDFRDGLDFVEIVRRGIETRSAYLRRLVQRITVLKPDVLINSAVPMVQAVIPLLPENILRISLVHSIMEHEPKIALAHGAWVDWVVAVSDSVRERVDRQNREGVKLSTIPVGLEIPSRKPPRQKAATPLRLIYVGRISPEKNLPGLLRVLTCLHDSSVPFTMTVVGDGPEMASVRSQAERLPCRGQLEFRGTLSPREVGDLLDEHDFLLMTSHFEGTPHVALEAMAHGLVVLVSHIPGATDRIITHGVDGFLCDKDATEDYVAILRRVSSDPAEFGAISAAARRTVLSRYSADTIVAQYESLFKGGRVSTKPAMELDGQVQVPRDLRLNFPGIILQAKHRLVDIWRQVARGRCPVSQVQGNPNTV